MNNLTGIAGVGLIVGCWNYIKTFCSNLSSLLIVRLTFEGGSQVAIKKLLITEFKRSIFGNYHYSCETEYVRPHKKSKFVFFEELPESSIVMWRRYRPIFVNKGGYNISFIRGCFNQEKLLLEAYRKYNDDSDDSNNWLEPDRYMTKHYTGSIGSPTIISTPVGENNVASASPPVINKLELKNFKFIHRPVGFSFDEIGQPKNKNAMKLLSLSNQATEAFNEALIWRNSETWYKDHGVPWKRGWALHGVPGTGKTAFVRALAQELNMPLHSFDLATMSNKDLLEYWYKALSYAPVIVLFEDIDAVFDHRQNIAKIGDNNSGVTFDCFLNVLDGIENTDGVFIVLTTNNIDKLDPAIGVDYNGDNMSSRPGRIDRLIEFGPLDYSGKLKMANRILSDFDEKLWKHVLTNANADTGAQFQERCCRLALRLYWNSK